MKTIKQYCSEAIYYAEHKDELEERLGTMAFDYQVFSFVIACNPIALIILLSYAQDLEQAFCIVLVVIFVDVMIYLLRYNKE